MDVISNNNWEDNWIDGHGLPDKVFMSRLDACLKILAKPGLLERVSSEDMWDIIRQTVKAYRPREDAFVCKPLVLKYRGLPLNNDAVVTKLYYFKEWLRRHISEYAEKEIKRDFPAAIGKADEEIYDAVKEGNPTKIDMATEIWSNVLNLEYEVIK